MEAVIKSPTPPTPPDPVKTAGAQTATNIGTAVANTAMGQVNQNTPYGSLEYEKRGDFEWKDPITGKTYTLPQYTSNITLSPEGQAIHDENMGAQFGMASAANRQANFLSDYLGKPADFDTDAIEGRLTELGRKRLDPRFEREEDALRTRLINSGLREGTRAWDSEMGRLAEAKNDAYNQLYLTGRGQAFNEIAAERNQPINETTALLSGSQIQAPNVSAATPARAATTDYAGIVNNNFNQQLGIYDRQNQQYQSTMGGLFGLGGGLLQAGMAFV